MTGCVMTLKGLTAPIIMTNDNDHAIMAAARVSAGRLVAFNMEDYFELCDWEPALCNGDSGVFEECHLRNVCVCVHAETCFVSHDQRCTGTKRVLAVLCLEQYSETTSGSTVLCMLSMSTPLRLSLSTSSPGNLQDPGICMRVEGSTGQPWRVG
jgi:hypothetical protein